MIAGIDLGTSSVKVIVSDGKETVEKVRVKYDREGISGFIEAVGKALSLVKSDIDGIALSSQVGTYVINGKEIISWQDKAGTEEVKKVKSSFTREEFVEEISMPHPDIISYPMPRIMYIKKNYDVERICQLKDEICAYLTGNCVSDIYSWRGLANIEKRCYSEKMLRFLGISESMLPKLLYPTDRAGVLCSKAAHETSLKEGTPVYVGCNDYYAGLLGMGITENGMMFDITGTSEHIGVTSDHIDIETTMVTSPYFSSNVTYGVTASSGVSLDFGIENFDFQSIDIDESLENGAPIFLPYLKGERAPIWNSGARGVFFGIGNNTTSSDMAYAILEGVVFSTYHIFENLRVDKMPSHLITAGGAAKDEKFNKLKACLFNIPVLLLKETDTSALGACMIGLTADKTFESFYEAALVLCKTEYTVYPEDKPILRERFLLYKKIYNDNIDNFNEFGRLIK